MIQPKDLRWTITHNSTPLVLTHAPDGWDETLVKWVRSDKYYGLFRSFTVPMRFVKEGAHKLKELYADYGIEAEATLLIEMLNRSTWTYETYFEGEVDFSKIKITDQFVEANLIEGGLVKYIKAKEDVTFEFSVSSCTTTTIKWNDLVNGTLVVDAQEVFEKLIDELTDGGVTNGDYGALIDTDIWDDGTVEYLWMTNGKCIRNAGYGSFTNKGKIKLTLQDFFESLNALFNCALTIETIESIPTACIRKKEYVYNSLSEVVDIGTVRNLTIMPYTDGLFNMAKIGYSVGGGSSEADREGGYSPDVYEANIYTGEWVLPVTRIKNEYNHTSKLRCDDIGSDNLYKGGTDYSNDWTSGDDDLWLICGVTQLGDPYPLFDDSKQVSPIVEDSVMCPNITPRRSMYKHLNYLAASVYGQSGGFISMKSNKGESNLTNIATKYGGGYENEYTAFTINGTLVNLRLFNPYVFEFDGYMDYEKAKDLLAENPNGYLTFTYNGNDYRGFILEVGANPTRKKVMTFRLLATPDTTLQTIHES